MDNLSNDYLFYTGDKEIINIIGNETIYYSNKIFKISSFSMKQERNMVLTNDSIYLLQNKKLKRKMKYEDLLGITFSNVSNEFILHGEKEYDMHFSHQEKETIIYIIVKCYENIMKKPLIICEIDEKSLKAYVTSKKDKKKDINNTKMDDSKIIDTQTYIIDNDPNEKNKRSYTETIGGKMNLIQNIIEESPHKINTDIIFCNVKNLNNISFNDFNIIKIIGRGNISKIFLVQHKNNNNFYALKTISKEIIENNSSFKSKLKIIQNLNHPFLININCCFETNNRVYFVLPYIQGERLSHYIQIKKNINEEKVKFYGASLILILEYLHKNEITSRDFTPNNIIIGQDGYIKLTPFNIETAFEIKKEVQEKIGLNEYNSPEILSNIEKEELKGSDWWNLGVIIFEMIYGIPPFYIDDENKLKDFINKTDLIFPRNFSLSESIKDLIKKLLKKKYKERLGYNKGAEELKKHEFFKGFNFDNLFERKIESPYKPDKMHIENKKIIEDKYTYEDLIKNGLIKAN